MAKRMPEYNIPKDFLNNKQQTLRQIDRSKKGSIDIPILSLIDVINTSLFFYTTSSCSGRIILYSEKSAGIKHNCKWIYTSHKECNIDDVIVALKREVTIVCNVITLKFEPLILHVCCANIECSKALMKVAVGCGYRNSGLSIGKKIMLAVRSTQGLEVPIGRDGSILVEEKYLKFLVEEANIKMNLNCERIKVLELAITNEIRLLEMGVCQQENKHQERTLIHKENGMEIKKLEFDTEFKDEDNILENIFT
ncbi:tRNA wybutosine-synthesizing protein 3-like protein isoform X1 [Oopsacas minuta]|uniref:tRNA wybutosine-synthesizing protein 3 homolog n=1 Tax=Oopsacas minuta TaxID=111878 RepID=A0AAV7KCA2_9METZ|nr:tRNA wybutosine-synthesizing protein 3-like protein isoform X1 [Oopsacas minuta]